MKRGLEAESPIICRTFLIWEEVADTASRLTARLDVLRENGAPATRELETRARLIEEEARGLASFVSSVRGLASEDQRKLHLEPTLIQRSIPKQAFRLRLGEGHLVADLPSDLPPLLANESVLDVVLKNLIRLGQRRSPRRHPVRVTGRVEDGTIIVSVRTEACGAVRATDVAIDQQAAPELRSAQCLLTLMGASIQPGALDNGGMEFRLVFSVCPGMLAEAELYDPTMIQMEGSEKDE
jgi:hypothetical protein